MYVNLKFFQFEKFGFIVPAYSNKIFLKKTYLYHVILASIRQLRNYMLSGHKLRFYCKLIF